MADLQGRLCQSQFCLQGSGKALVQPVGERQRQPSAVPERKANTTYLICCIDRTLKVQDINLPRQVGLQHLHVVLQLALVCPQQLGQTAETPKRLHLAHTTFVQEQLISFPPSVS